MEVRRLMARVCTVLTPTGVSEAVEKQQMRINIEKWVAVNVKCC